MDCLLACAPHECSVRGQKRVSDPLRLGLQMIVSLYVGAGNWTQVLWKNSAVNHRAITLGLNCTFSRTNWHSLSYIQREKNAMYWQFLNSGAVVLSQLIFRSLHQNLAHEIQTVFSGRHFVPSSAVSKQELGMYLLQCISCVIYSYTIAFCSNSLLS